MRCSQGLIERVDVQESVARRLTMAYVLEQVRPDLILHDCHN